MAHFGTTGKNEYQLYLKKQYDQKLIIVFFLNSVDSVDTLNSYFLLILFFPFFEQSRTFKK